MIGQHLGKYLITRKLGEGGMGAVYEALDESLQRRVAIKVLHRHYAHDPHLAGRFFNEARAANIADHPGVVQIWEIGQAPDGTAYLVMEYLRGETLEKRLSRNGGVLAGREALRLARQIAAALAAVHDKGIVHRDLKPSNVMLVPDQEPEGQDRARLFDFGIAKFAAEVNGAAAETMQTATGVLMGTPAYMAPEQCHSASHADDRSDVYSLGIMLYRMLAGGPPFRAETPAGLIVMQLQAAPPPLREIDPSISEEVALLVHAMLAKSPASRPSMAQVLAALQRLTAAPPMAPVASASSTLGGSLGEASGSRRTPLPVRGVAAGALLCALLIGAGLWSQMRPASPVAGQAPVQVPTLVAAPSAGPIAAPAPGPPHREVRWSISTEPPGAEVVEKDSGEVLGKTPCEIRRESGPGAAIVGLRLRGYVEKDVKLERTADNHYAERLERLPQAAAPRPASKRHVQHSGRPGGAEMEKRDEDIPFRD